MKDCAVNVVPMANVLVSALLCCFAFGCVSTNTPAQQRMNKPSARVQLTSSAVLTPLTANELVGSWEMSQTIKTGRARSETRTIKIVFLNNGRCKATLDNTYTNEFEYEYKNGRLEIGSYWPYRPQWGRKHPTFWMLKARYFEVLRRDTQTFELRFHDLMALSDELLLGGKSCFCEQLADGSIKATNVRDGGTLVTTYSPMIFRRSDDASEYNGSEQESVEPQLSQPVPNAFPEDKLVGDWRMSKVYTVEVDPGNGTPPTESEQRLTVSLSFIGGNQCRATFDIHSQHAKPNTKTYEYRYSDGNLLFTGIEGKNITGDFRHWMFGSLSASQFKLVKRDDDSFEMVYADLKKLGKYDGGMAGMANSTCKCEYLGDGTLKKVRSLGAITMTERHPPMIFKRITHTSSALADKKSSYRLRAFGRKEGNDFTYGFKVEFPSNNTVAQETIDSMLSELKVAIVEDYAESFSDVDIGSLFIDFVDCSNENGIVEGCAEVLTISVLSFSYSPQTRIGMIEVKYNSEQLDAARQYVKRNIANIVRDKNVALVTGEVPLDATVAIEGEEVRDGNILGITFRAIE